MNKLNINLGFKLPSAKTIEDSIWIYPDQETLQNNKHVVLLVHGKDNTGYGCWSWSYAAQLPHDGFIPATITLPHCNTANLNVSGKFIAGAIWLLRKNFPSYKISIVAHSMGNMATSWALHYRPTYMSKNITNYVALGAPFQGINSTAPKLLPNQPALLQITPQSKFVKKINSTPFPKAINYLSIISQTDEIASGMDPKKLASFPNGTVGNVETPQDFYKTNKNISHVGELADNGIYEMVKAFLNGTKPNQNAAKTDYYPFMEKEGLDLTEKYGNEISHKGDAPYIRKEPKQTDCII